MTEVKLFRLLNTGLLPMKFLNQKGKNVFDPEYSNE
jgi:hypothetical protein